jgi:hypothetical protein
MIVVCGVVAVKFEKQSPLRNKYGLHLPGEAMVQPVSKKILPNLT